MACQDCGENSTTLPVGPTGTDGANGQNGNYGGFSGQWIFNTNNGSGGLSTGQLRMNSVHSNLVTEIYIHNTGYSGINYTAFLDSFSNSGNFGNIRIFQNYVVNTFALYEITAVDTTLNGSTAVKLTVTYLSGGLGTNVWNNGDQVVVSFAGNGAPGADAIIVADGESSDLGGGVVLNTGAMTKLSSTETGTLAAGTYLFWAEIHLAPELANAIAEWKYYVGGVAQGTLRAKTFLQTGLYIIPVNEKLILASPAKVAIYAKSSVHDVTLYLQSVQYLKIA